MTETQTLFTADEYYRHPDGEKPGELVRGEIRVMSPAGGMHGRVIISLLRALIPFVDAHDLGECFADNVGFALDIPGADADTVRSPDIAFVRAERVPPDDVIERRGFVPVAPDLAVEVLSPSQTAEDMDERMADYFAAGTQVMWVVSPKRRTVAIHSPSEPPRFLQESDVLEGGDLLPGFALPVASLFRRIARG